MRRAATINDIKSELTKLYLQKTQVERHIKSLEGTLVYFATLPEDSVSETVSNMAYDILVEKGSLHRKEIHDLIISRGGIIHGADSVNNVGAHMSGDSRFRSLGSGIWDIDESQRTRLREITA